MSSEPLSESLATSSATIFCCVTLIVSSGVELDLDAAALVETGLPGRLASRDVDLIPETVLERRLAGLSISMLKTSAVGDLDSVGDFSSV